MGLEAVALMEKRNKLMHTKESVEAGRAFRPVLSDIFIVTSSSATLFSLVQWRGAVTDDTMRKKSTC